MRKDLETDNSLFWSKNILPERQRLALEYEFSNRFRNQMSRLREYTL